MKLSENSFSFKDKVDEEFSQKVSKQDSLEIEMNIMK